jgi:hypothetical protein
MLFTAPMLPVVFPAWDPRDHRCPTVKKRRDTTAQLGRGPFHLRHNGLPCCGANVTARVVSRRQVLLQLFDQRLVDKHTEELEQNPSDPRASVRWWRAVPPLVAQELHETVGVGVLGGEGLYYRRHALRKETRLPLLADALERVLLTRYTLRPPRPCTRHVRHQLPVKDPFFRYWLH